MLALTPASAAALVFLFNLPRFAPPHQTLWRPVDVPAVVAVSARTPAAGFLGLYQVAYVRVEDILIDELERFDRKGGELRRFEQLLGGLAHMGSRRGIPPIIRHLATDFNAGRDFGSGPVSAAHTGVSIGSPRTVYPAHRAILHIGEPAFLPLIDEFLRTAAEAKKKPDDLHGPPEPFFPLREETAEERAAILRGAICGALRDGKRVARALDEAKRRLFANPDDKKVVRGCKELIRCLMKNDGYHEIYEFKTNFPPPWWDKFKE